MRVFNKDLKKGLQLIQTKKHSQAIGFLEPKIPIFLEDQSYYYLLSYAFYKINDLGAAKFYLERGILLDPSTLELKLLLAVVHLRRKDSTSAAKVWLSVLERDPDNKWAKKGLERLRKMNDKQQLMYFMEKGKHHNLVPGIGIAKNRFIRRGVLLALLVGISLCSIIFIPPWLKQRDQVNRQELLYVDMKLRDNSLTDPQSSFTYLMTTDEIEDSYQKVIDYYDNYKDNLAQREANRLINSNASQEIKSKLFLLEGYFKKPEYLDFYTNFSYAQALADPLLYDNCYILWTGRIGNLEILQDKIQFKFIVGFEDEIDFDGVIPAYVNYEVRIDPEMAVEILGRLQWQNNQLILKVESIRHIIPED
ncbi:MAG: hypothetical protein PF447_05430 [Spirochaetaceae bacterium]|jgi:tetratricopeptide (TPR) repeat protein|nr:hypothetical protein [Spirochaetaceae bacterium]